MDSNWQTVESASMSNEGPENPIPSTLTEGLKRKRGRPKKQPQVREHHPKRLPEDAMAVA